MTPLKKGYGTNAQRDTFDDIYRQPADRWAFHTTSDPLTRFLRDRRLNRALLKMKRMGVPDEELIQSSVLVVCGGVGGEGKYFADLGCRQVTVADLSSKALEICSQLDPRLETLEADSEGLNLPDGAFDIVVVQDGLHHLPRPVLGFTEMLRVARRVVMVIEPHLGLVGRVLGREWEQHAADGATNFVFRWNHELLRQATKSYLLHGDYQIESLRFWDHALAVSSLVENLPERLRLSAARVLYGLLEPLGAGGNMFVGIVVKNG